LAEIAGINEIYQQRRLEFDVEKRRLNSEIERLQAQIAEGSKRDETTTSAGIQALLRTRERLTREEFERKYQELAAEVRRQRKKYAEQVDEMKNQLSGCLCKVSRLSY
jgi:DNA repair exonuclease SbcCD ATPase subunit